MAAYKLESNVELTERIVEMIEGETTEVLEDIIDLLNYYSGFKAGIFNGEETLSQILRNKSVR